MRRVVPPITRWPYLGVLLVTAGWLGPVDLRAQVRSQFGVMIPMRDGVKLAADLWLPSAPGTYPSILIRTPYMKTMGLLHPPEMGKYFATRGYVLVVQDTRGRGDSEGSFDFFFPEGPDGYDTIEWLAAQPWSNGRVGMMGVSYMGTVQWLAARDRPPHLSCIAPTAAAGRWLEELPYQGGAFAHQFALDWLNGTSGRISQDGNAGGIGWERVLAHRPLLTADSVMGRPMRLYREWVQNPLLNAYWKRIQFGPEDFGKIDIPTLTVTGWYDGDQPGALFYWRGLMAGAPRKDQHFLLAGPWTHVQTFAGGELQLGETKFTPESILDHKALHAAFFDWCLKGSSLSVDFPRARIYVTGANVWRSYPSYPPPGSAARPLYLHSGGRANSLDGDGRLSWTAPGDQPPDRYTYDPKHPTPSDGADESLAIDRRPVQRRDDVLVYTGEPLAEPVEVIGNVVVNLHASSDATDTDFTAVLSDVQPDGRALRLGMTIGIRRARYRNGYDKEELLTPNRAEMFRIELYDIAHSFQPGHRIRLEVSSSAAPQFNPNQNTGRPVATDTTWQVAHQTIYHDRAHASVINLPMVSRPPSP